MLSWRIKTTSFFFLFFVNSDSESRYNEKTENQLTENLKPDYSDSSPLDIIVSSAPHSEHLASSVILGCSSTSLPQIPHLGMQNHISSLRVIFRIYYINSRCHPLTSSKTWKSKGKHNIYHIYFAPRASAASIMLSDLPERKTLSFGFISSFPLGIMKLSSL